MVIGKNFFSKGMMSVLLSATMTLSLFAGLGITAYADEDSSVTTSVAGSGDVMDLTEEGNLDWIHFGQGGILTRKTNATDSITYEALDGVKQINEAGDSALGYAWSDGNEIESGQDNKAAVFGYNNGNLGDIDAGVGFNLSVGSSDEERTFKFAAGLWESSADVSIKVNGDEIYSNSLEKHGAEITVYTVNVAAGDSVLATVKLTGTTNDWGNVTLGGAALKANEATEPDEPDEPDEPEEGGNESHAVLCTSETLAPGSAMNLTEEGSKDWRFIDGEQDDRKADGQGLDVEFLRNSGFATFFDSKMSCSWTDGTNVASNKGTTRGKVFIGRSYQSRELPENAQVGYAITVASSDAGQVLSFVAGAWEGTATVKVYDGNSEVWAESFTAGGSAVQKKYTIAAEAGAIIKVVTKLTAHTNYNDGNITVCGIALKEQSVEDSTKEVLAKCIDKAKKLDYSNYQADKVSALKEKISLAESVLSDRESTMDAIKESYRSLLSAFEACINSPVSGQYKYQTNSGLTSSFGWEGDLNAPIAYIDGSYLLRDRDGITVGFGVRDITEKISWFNAEGYLPCFVSKYSKDGCDYEIQNFSNKHEIDGKAFEVAYSRMIVTNNTEEAKTLPMVSSVLYPINEAAKNATSIEPGQTIIRDYGIFADRFDGDYDYPAEAALDTLGSFDDNYDAMRDYWNDRLSPLASIDQLPDTDLINAYKAGFIYTLIIRDDVIGEDGQITKELHVGENGYDIMFDHDTIGIVASLLTIGDYTYAKDYLASLPAKLQYDDAKWKFSWPYALYLDKTGDIDFILSQFETIKGNTHMVESDRDMNAGGIIKKTDAIDSHGYWLIDNWSALTGLSTYSYLCDKLYEKTGEETYKTEGKWADDLYKDLLKSVEDCQRNMRERYDYPYLSIDMNLPTEQSARGDVRDANWASMFLFGRWAWDGYLYGADQADSEMISLIDDTYTHGFERRANTTDTIYNFGGYPHGYFSSAYNAGYGSAALRGEEYRDSGIKAYQFMIDKAMSGPFGWWEGVNYPNSNSPWDIDHAQGGGGSCQHMWGQSTATKVLFDSLIAEKSGDKIIIGRGIPAEWECDDQVVEISDVSVDFGKKTGYKMTSADDKITIEFTGDRLSVPYSIELLAMKDNIASVYADGQRVTKDIDRKAGTALIKAGTKKVVVNLGAEQAVEKPSNPSRPNAGGNTNSPRAGRPSAGKGNSSQAKTPAQVTIPQTITPVAGLRAEANSIRKIAKASDSKKGEEEAAEETSDEELVDEESLTISSESVDASQDSEEMADTEVPTAGAENDSNGFTIFGIAVVILLLLAIAFISFNHFNGSKKH
ncbi:MAG: hypothetical protein K5773_07015 [Pseudobutyrivibrio sp.]|nr:hypothetical protein [Pseudobutyrivibrio sp.]